MVALAGWLLMPRFVQLDALSSLFWVRDVEVSTHWLLRISPYGYRRRDVEVWEVHHSVMYEQQRERGNAPAFHDWEKFVLFNYWLEFRILSVS